MPGNAGSNTAVDRITVLDAALAQVPDQHRHGTAFATDTGFGKLTHLDARHHAHTWTQHLLLHDHLARTGPKTLR